MASFFDSYFSKEQVRAKLVAPQLDFSLDPKEFLEWLKKTGEDINGNTYNEIVSNMCEYSCLYIAKVLENISLKGELKVCYGDYGYWEHYWMSYTLAGIEYFVDLTLAQFDPNAPELSISLGSESQHVTCYNNIYYISLKEFLDTRRRDLEIIEQGKAVGLKGWFNQLNPFENINFDNISLD